MAWTSGSGIRRWTPITPIPSTVELALTEWAEVFQQLPRIDAVFVPGGDPGHTRPKVLMALLEKQTANLQRFHPNAQMWVSPQSFSQDWLDEFLASMRAEPAWLAGSCSARRSAVSLPELRKALPGAVPHPRLPGHHAQPALPVPGARLGRCLFV